MEKEGGASNNVEMGNFWPFALLIEHPNEGSICMAWSKTHHCEIGYPDQTIASATSVKDLSTCSDQQMHPNAMYVL